MKTQTKNTLIRPKIKRTEDDEYVETLLRQAWNLRKRFLKGEIFSKEMKKQFRTTEYFLKKFDPEFESDQLSFDIKKSKHENIIGFDYL